MRNNPTNLDYLKQKLAELSDDLSVPWDTYPCLEWARGKTANGYGSLCAGPKLGRVHRAAYELTFGPIPNSLLVCHHCDNRICFRPSHLFIGTHADNTADCMSKGRTANGERHGQAKLTEDQVRSIRAKYASGGATQRALAREFGVAYPLICRVVHGKRWAHIT